MNAYPTHRCIECSLMRCFGPGERCEAQTCQAAVQAEVIWRPYLGIEYLDKWGADYDLPRLILEPDHEYRGRLLRRISGETG